MTSTRQNCSEPSSWFIRIAMIVCVTLGFLGQEPNALAQVRPTDANLLGSPHSDEVLSQMRSLERNWGAEWSRLSLGISLTKPSYQFGETVLARITLTNASEKKISFSEHIVDGVRTDLELILIQGTRQLAASRRPNTEQTPRNYATGRSQTCEPGETVETVVRIGSVFDLQPNQNYLIYAKKRIADGPRLITELVSGNATFTVLGDGHQPGLETGQPGAFSSASAGTGGKSLSVGERNISTSKTSAASNAEASQNSAPSDNASNTSDSRIAVATSLSSAKQGIARTVFGFVILTFCLCLILAIVLRARKRAREANNRLAGS